jgi:hypothetical protein
MECRRGLSEAGVVMGAGIWWKRKGRVVGTGSSGCRMAILWSQANSLRGRLFHSLGAEKLRSNQQKDWEIFDGGAAMATLDELMWRAGAARREGFGVSREESRSDSKGRLRGGF